MFPNLLLAMFTLVRFGLHSVAGLSGNSCDVVRLIRLNVAFHESPEK